MGKEIKYIYDAMLKICTDASRFISVVNDLFIKYGWNPVGGNGVMWDRSTQQYKHVQPQKTRDSKKDQRLLLETKISEVLSRLSIEPSKELEMEFQKLLKEKRELDINK